MKRIFLSPLFGKGTEISSPRRQPGAPKAWFLCWVAPCLIHPAMGGAVEISLTKLKIRLATTRPSPYQAKNNISDYKTFIRTCFKSYLELRL